MLSVAEFDCKSSTLIALSHEPAVADWLQNRRAQQEQGTFLVCIGHDIGS